MLIKDDNDIQIEVQARTAAANRCFALGNVHFKLSFQNIKHYYLQNNDKPIGPYSAETLSLTKKETQLGAQNKIQTKVLSWKMEMRAKEELIATYK